MDTMSARQFITLHGQKLYDDLVKPIIESKPISQEDIWTIAWVNGVMIDRVLGKFPQIQSSPSSLERRSFLTFKKNYIKEYGLLEWSRLIQIISLLWQSQVEHQVFLRKNKFV